MIRGFVLKICPFPTFLKMTSHKQKKHSNLFSFFFKLHFGKTIYFQNKTIMTKSEKRYISQIAIPPVFGAFVYCLYGYVEGFC